MIQAKKYNVARKDSPVIQSCFRVWATTKSLNLQGQGDKFLQSVDQLQNNTGARLKG